MPLTHDAIAADRQLVDDLTELCDVELIAAGSEPPLCQVEGVSDLNVFGRDGSGGQFAMSAASGQVFYFSSEGQAGAVAKDFATFMTIVAALPLWRDVLHYSSHGKIAEMRRAAEALEENLFDDEDAETSRGGLVELLDRAEEIDVVAELHASVSSKVVIHDLWGNLTQSLFGRFTIDDNPMLRPMAD